MYYGGKMYYTMEQISKIFNMTKHTIRYYTDIGLLPCERDAGNRRLFNDESVNWLQGIKCLKGCGMSIEAIKEYCDLCLLEESRENLKKRYTIILNQRNEAYKKLEEAKTNVTYMEDKVKHYEDILLGIIQDDTNPLNWTKDNKPQMH